MNTSCLSFLSRLMPVALALALFACSNNDEPESDPATGVAEKTDNQAVDRNDEENPENDDPMGGMIWDISPTYIIIDLVDDERHLLDPFTEEGLGYINQITVEGEDSVYHAVDPYNVLENENIDLSRKDQTLGMDSRALLAMFYGLYINAFFEPGKGPWEQPLYYFTLSFGEFQTEGSHSLEFKVNWPDGAESNVEYEHWMEWVDYMPVLHNTLIVDGQEQTLAEGVRHKLQR